jgi:hypothetical protein
MYCVMENKYYALSSRSWLSVLYNDYAHLTICKAMQTCGKHWHDTIIFLRDEIPGPLNWFNPASFLEVPVPA